MIKHRWKLSDKTSPSGKILYYCPLCKLYDPAPVKDDSRECAEDKYADSFEVKDGKVYSNL